MKVYLSTTGTQTPVVINDIGGKRFVHPTTNYDLSDEYTIEELQKSKDLQDAITAGYITMKDDSNQSLLILENDLGGVKEITSNVEQWNADRLGSIPINSAGAAPGKVVAVNPTTSGLLYTDKSGIAGVDPLFLAMAEPTGFPNRTDSLVSFNNGNRMFTVAPAVTSFDIYIKGTKYSYNTAQQVQIGNLEGIWFIYFNSSGVLTASQSLWSYSENVLVAAVYWDLDGLTSLFREEERHGIVMDWRTHQYLHETRGTWLNSGLDIGNYTVSGDGSQNSHAQMSFANAVISDEDILIGITNAAIPVNDFEQVLSTVAKIPVYYRTATEAAPKWKKDTATLYPVKQGTSRIKYNLLSGGAWTTPDVPTDGYFVPMWIAVTNCPSEPVVAILGTSVHASLTNAIGTASLDVTKLPFREFRCVYRIIFSTSSTYANTPKAVLRHVLRIVEDEKSATSVDIVANKLTGAYTNSSFFTASNGNDYVDSQTANWQVMASLIYDGSDVTKIETFRIVFSRAGSSGISSVRLFDLTNNQQLAQIDVTAIAKALYKTSDIANLPAGEAILEIQAKTTGSKGNFHSYKIV